MKKFSLVLSLVMLFSVCVFGVNAVYATSNQASCEIVLSDDGIMVNGEAISEDSAMSIYLSKDMNNGGTSDEALAANIKVDNVVNIKAPGTYRVTGILTSGQIAIDTNVIDGDVEIVLAGASITCADGPAIVAYNVNTKTAENCNVTIRTEKDTENYVYGARVKTSVIGWPDQESIVYNIEKGTNDEGQYFEQYKYDGAISADITLTFEGEGTLKFESKREGIEVKGDVIINSGNYIFNTDEDGINACLDGESIIEINGGTILVATKKDGPQGDGIDSNGYLYINGGTVYSFANPTTEDSGIDSDLGIYINGGNVVATGNMYDMIETESKQDFILIPFSEKIPEGTLITLVDEKDEPVIAFKTEREYTILTLSNPELEMGSYTVYKGGTIEGESTNGLYTNITSYTKGEKVDVQIYAKEDEYRGRGPSGNMMPNQMMKEDLNVGLIIVLGVVAGLCIGGAVILINKEKGRVANLFLGMIAGGAIVAIIFLICNVTRMNNQMDMFRYDKNFERFSGDMPQMNQGQQYRQMDEERIPEGAQKNITF